MSCEDFLREDEGDLSTLGSMLLDDLDDLDDLSPFGVSACL